MNSLLISDTPNAPGPRPSPFPSAPSVLEPKRHEASDVYAIDLEPRPILLSDVPSIQAARQRQNGEGGHKLPPWVRVA